MTIYIIKFFIYKHIKYIKSATIQVTLNKFTAHIHYQNLHPPISLFITRRLPGFTFPKKELFIISVSSNIEYNNLSNNNDNDKTIDSIFSLSILASLSLS